MSSTPPITVATEDRQELQELVERFSGSEVSELLEVELDRAKVVPLSEVPEGTVVMNSDVEYEDTSSHQRRQLRLVYPPDADPEAGRISVMAPLGCALLGLTVGQEIDWQMPGGQRRLRVISVTRAPR